FLYETGYRVAFVARCTVFAIANDGTGLPRTGRRSRFWFTSVHSPLPPVESGVICRSAEARSGRAVSEMRSLSSYSRHGSSASENESPRHSESPAYWLALLLSLLALAKRERPSPTATLPRRNMAGLRRAMFFTSRARSSTFFSRSVLDMLLRVDASWFA